MAQGDTTIQHHNPEKASVVDGPMALQDNSFDKGSSLSASNDAEKRAQSSTESADTIEGGQSYLVSPWSQGTSTFMLTHLSPLQVTWDDPDDSTNPHNWPTLFRWVVTVVVSCGGFVTMMSGSMIAPALPALSHDLHISEASAQLTLSIFVLAFGFGPLFLAHSQKSMDEDQFG